MSPRNVDKSGAVIYEGFHGNCGMGIVCDLTGHPEGMLLDFHENGYDFDRPSIVAFSDNDRNKNGDTLAKYIRKHKLGAVRRSTTTRNLNSGNNITAWYWTVDHNKFKAWVKRAQK